MKIVKFPGKLPSPEQLVLPQAQLSELVHNLTNDLLQRQLDLMKANNASELAAAVRKTSAGLAEASAGWSAMSQTIRDSWGI